MGMTRALPVLCATMLALTLCANAQEPAPPEIARIQGGNTRTIWGAGFTDDVEVWGWNPEFEEDAAKTALVVGSAAQGDASSALRAYDPAALLPNEPPSGAQRLRVLARDERGFVMAVDFFGQYHAGGFYDARAGHQVVWVKNAAGFSKPRLVRSADPWFAYPEEAQPGEIVRVFGRTLDARLAALRSVDSPRVAFAEVTGRGRHPLYEAAIRLPKELPPGEYELVIHNGAGGTAGWGGPVRLAVRRRSAPAEPRVFDAREFGARGNGIADDTEALRAALVAAGEAGGGVVSLTPGRYAISGTLWTPSGVTLQGAGAANSILCVREDRPMRWNVPGPIAEEMPGHFRHRQADGNLGAMLWMRDDSTVANVGFEDGPGTLL
ncbi:MAG: glycosyl hydrolase family 28-related protein, partial [Thermoguttaceae bacterium]